MIDKKIIKELNSSRRVTLPKQKLNDFDLKRTKRRLKFYIQGEREDWIGTVYVYTRQSVIRIPDRFKIKKNLTLWFTDDLNLNLYILKEVNKNE